MNYLCPTCEKEVVVGKPCPHCEKKKRPKTKAAQEHKSWEQEETADGLDLPDEDFDYEAFIGREFSKAPHRQMGLKWYWYAVAVFLLVLWILLVF